MITSGSHAGAIDVAEWRLPEGTALRYERPAAPLRGLIPSYAVLDSDPAVFIGPSSWLLPGRAQIWIGFTAVPVRVQARSRPLTPLGTAMLFGPSATAMPVASNGGITVVIDIAPRGWARLFRTPADAVRDRIVPLDTCWPAALIDELVARLQASDLGAGVKDVLDGFFADRLPPPSPDEEVAGRINDWLAVADGGTVATWHEGLGLGSARVLAAACSRSFGYGPKMLYRRRRFVRAITALLVADAPDFGTAPPGYYDVPHFHRDARDFLGMTARRFLAMPMLYLRAALRARMEVIGAAVPLLDTASAMAPA